MFPNTIVVGGGIGGLAAATALAQHGTAVTLLEQAPAITEVGAGIQISPNGLAVLRSLGLSARLRRVSVRARAVVLEDFRDGRSVARLPMQAEGREYHFVHRADLIALLRQGAKEANVTFELGAKVVDVIPGDVPRVQLADGTTRQARLVVCADGLRSVGRQVLNGEGAPQFTGQVAWRALVPVSEGFAPQVHVSMGPGRHVVRYPLRGGRLMNLVAVQERKEWAAEGWSQRDDPANLRAAFADFGGPVGDLIKRAEEVHLWGLFRHPVAPVWQKGNVVLLGDAAHPTLPFLAQGANMALEDSVALLQAVAGGGLPAYEAARRKRTAKIVQAASRNAWKYHFKPGPVRWMGHRALGLVSRIAPGLMTRPFDWIYDFDETAKNPARPRI